MRFDIFFRTIYGIISKLHHVIAWPKQMPAKPKALHLSAWME